MSTGGCSSPGRYQLLSSLAPVHHSDLNQHRPLRLTSSRDLEDLSVRLLT